MRLLKPTELDSKAVRRRIVEKLQSCQAISMNSLCEGIGVDRQEVKKELDFLIDNKEVEVLRPLPPLSFYNRGGGRWLDSGKNEEPEHFRLIRDTDEDYLWEQGVVARFPVSRMRDEFRNEGALEFNDSGESAAGYVPWFRKIASLAFALPGL